MPERIDVACEMVKSYCLAGLQVTMNQFNKK
jgi:PTH1 family peptidyl-tRNA hydrolase